MGERQCLQGSKGKAHLQGTRGKGGGMLRKRKGVGPETRTVSDHSGTDSRAAKA